MTAAERHARAQLGGLLDHGNPFVAAAAVLITESGVTVRKWRSNLTGTAYYQSDDWGIESPPPTTALRFAVFAHEVGHQTLHRSGSLPRWLEEVQAWDWSLAQFARFDFEITDAVAADAEDSVRHSFRKALRRGLAPSALYANPEAQWWAVQLDANAIAEALKGGPS